ncbi:D-cysteine desulfhydrase family protein [Pseudovibrio sp. Tun.PSC04-5.I4]|uniref:D-cysteine desulfhydrase family protein n=1 Tax=Pseudovibrio sp. Tun.PSC04-5.I4 TaxID=1798213 RepID=UPI00087F2438|nr:D-cysteine desulfhydrase family protein [Pseudovibrio sp. Tun.PSC04-5.I4]SDQ14016.1 D-cysteine desulfhydrase [Pseudovibrio sp. Tun.PSC04-5.I4]
MFPEKIEAFLQKFERATVGHFPTPIEKLSGTFPASSGPNVYIKRDDCTGLGLGGNKTRKLEYLIADAMKRGYTTIFTTGGIQSNHARQTAAMAAKCNLDCELFLTPVAGTPERNYKDNGNVLLDELFGAKIRICEDEKQVDVRMEERAQELGADNVYIVPIGGSNPIGSLGYIRCAQEILEQSQQAGISFDAIVIATGSCGTQAGLVAGLEIAGVNTPVYGYCVSRDGDEQAGLVMELLERCSEEIGTPENPHRLSAL